MHIESLVRMANQIGSFFEAMPDHAEALEGVALHIKKFWDPRMRRELFQHLDARAGEGLSPFTLEALTRHRAMLG